MSRKRKQLKEDCDGYVTVQFIEDGILFDCQKKDLKNVDAKTNCCLARWRDKKYYEAKIIQPKRNELKEGNFSADRNEPEGQNVENGLEKGESLFNSRNNENFTIDSEKVNSEENENSKLNENERNESEEGNFSADRNEPEGQNVENVETRGKRGKAVPILLTPLMRNAVDILCDASNRALMDIFPTNRRLFAISRSEDGYLRGCVQLKEQTELCGLENPSLMRSTKLRKQLGIMTQLCNLEENELDTLARHMGHDIRVHREYYRLPDHTIDLAKVSKQLISRNKGIDLGDITITENDLAMSESDPDDPDEMNDEETNVDNDNINDFVSKTPCRIVQPSKEKLTRKRFKPSEQKPSTRKQKPSTRKQKSSTREPIMKKKWSEEELNALKTYFVNYLNGDTLPGKSCFEDCMEKFPILASRSWRILKDRLRQLQIMSKKKIVEISNLVLYLYIDT